MFPYFRVMAGVNFWHMEKQYRGRAVQMYCKINKRCCLDLCAWNEIHRPSEEHYHPDKIPRLVHYFKEHNPYPSDLYLMDIFFIITNPNS